MMRLRTGLSVAASLIAFAAFAVPGADAQPKAKRHHRLSYSQPAPQRPLAFPTYVDRGTDRNPGGDDLYYTDTRYPRYELGPSIFQKFEDQ